MTVSIVNASTARVALSALSAAASMFRLSDVALTRDGYRYLVLKWRRHLEFLYSLHFPHSPPSVCFSFHCGEAFFLRLLEARL
jgi:nucleoside-specific outer membrane channel protein Tsx